MKNYLILFLLLPLLLLAPGCWDLRDVNNTAFVLGIGIDSASDLDPAKYKVTFQFAKPLSAHQTPIAQTLIASTEADSILQAIQSIQSRISRSISLSHLRVVVIGEDIARQESFKDLTNYFMREPDLALQVRLVIVQNAQARDLFYSNPGFEERHSAELVAMGRLSNKLAIVRTNSFIDFVTDLKSTKGTALCTRVFINKDENVIVQEGSAVFKDWKLAAWLNAEEVQASNWLVEKNLAVVVAKEGENTYTYEITKMDSKFKPTMEEGQPSFLVNVTTEGMVMEEYGKDLDLSKAENLNKMELLFAETISQEVKSAIEKSQNEIKADYLGFSKAFRKYESDAYKSINWSNIYPSIPIEVQVNCKVKAYGLRK